MREPVLVNNTDENVRKLIDILRSTPLYFEIFKEATIRKFPKLEQTFDVALRLYGQLMGDFSIQPPAFEDFWKDIYDFLLRLSFIHPKMFFDKNDVAYYSLSTSIEMISDSWGDFIIMNLDISPLQLTRRRLVEHNIEHCDDESTMSGSVSSSKSTKILPIQIPSEN